MSRRADGTGCVFRRGDRDGWYIAVSGPDGRRVRRKGGATQREALAALKKLRAQVWGRANDVPLGASLAKYLVDDHLHVLESRLEPRVYKLHASRLRSIALYFRAKPMEKISRADAERFLADLAQGWQPPVRNADGKLVPPEPKRDGDGEPIPWRKRKPNTINRWKSVASVCWKDAERRGLVERNIWQGIYVQRAQQHAVAFISEADLAKIYKAADERHRPAFVLYGETGCRRGELLGMQWRDIALDGEIPTATVRESKTRRVRYVPLRPLALAALEVLRKRAGGSPAPDERILASIGETWNRRARAAWQVAGDAAGRGRLRLHDLRHARASLLVRAGVPMPTVAQWLGHVDSTLVARTYGHHAPETALAQALRKSIDA